MRVDHFGGSEHIATSDELKAIMNKRYGENANDIWISLDDTDYPQLAILVKDDLAFAFYMSNDSHPGFTSISAGTNLDPSEITVFFNNTPTEWIEFYNRQVISAELAVEVAMEFYSSPTDLPKAINWLEL